MKINKYFNCCEKCFEEIGKRSSNAARLWMDLCALCLSEGKIIKIHSQDFPELRYLETLGYVVSTDKPQDVVVRVNGLNTTEDGEHFFCLSRGNHAWK